MDDDGESNRLSSLLPHKMYFLWQVKIKVVECENRTTAGSREIKFDNNPCSFSIHVSSQER